MAEENTATSSHLDSYMHVYDNGTTARLYVTPWDRNTVADGYWQTVNTIQPLINRDIYLADALDKLANKYTVYSAGFGVNITYNEPDDNYFISVDIDDILHNIPRYSFEKKQFTTAQDPDVDGVTRVGLKLNPDGYITASDNGIYCNVDYMMFSTTSLSSYSAITANVISSFTYDYSVSNDHTITAMGELPPAPGVYNLYLIG
jgi:hypothetical protein